MGGATFKIDGKFGEYMVEGGEGEVCVESYRRSPPTPHHNPYANPNNVAPTALCPLCSMQVGQCRGMVHSSRSETR